MASLRGTLPTLRAAVYLRQYARATVQINAELTKANARVSEDPDAATSVRCAGRRGAEGDYMQDLGCLVHRAAAGTTAAERD